LPLQLLRLHHELALAPLGHGALLDVGQLHALHKLGDVLRLAVQQRHTCSHRRQGAVLAALRVSGRA